MVGLESRLGTGRGEAWRGCVGRGGEGAGRAGTGPARSHAGSRGRGAWPWQEMHAPSRELYAGESVLLPIPMDELMDGIILAGLLSIPSGRIVA